VDLGVGQPGVVIDGAVHELEPDPPGALTPDHRRGKHIKTGFDYIHIAVDDHSRVAYAEIHPDEKAATCAGTLHVPQVHTP
jgi:hypothetical protein